MALKKSPVGIDIGHANIRIAQAERTAVGFQIMKYAVTETPKGAIRDGQIVEPEEVGLAIKRAMKEAHISASVASLAAAGGAVFIRTVQFPKMTAQMLRDSIRFEAGRYIPGSVDDSYVVGEIVGPHGETQIDVLLVASPKDIVNARIRACEIAGLNVDYVETETFATYRSLLEFDPDREVGSKTYMLVNIGAANTAVSVIQNGVYLMHRSMPNAGNMLTEALKQAFKLDTIDAEAGKTVLDLEELLSGDGSDNPPLKVIATMVDDIVRELRRSMNFLQTQPQSGGGKPNATVDKMVLCGGGAKLKGLAKYIHSKLGIPVEVIGTFDGPYIENGGCVPGNGVEATVVAGLAVRPFLKAA